MATVYASNVTKYNAGGSGDNIISDGYIKTVEKVWLDSYTIAFTATNSTVDIAMIPSNKKITGIDVMIYTTASQTSGTISIGTAASATQFLPATQITHNNTQSCLSFPSGGAIGSVVADSQLEWDLAGFQMITSGTTGTIRIAFSAWTMTTGTVKTIVRYT